MATVKMNVSVNYNEGLFYVDYKDIFMYHEIKNPSNYVVESKIPKGHESEYEYDADMTQANYDAFRKKLTKYMTTNFPSIQETAADTFSDRAKKKRIIAKNKLFEIVLEDNIWSVAVELKRIKKAKTGLQTQMFPSFLAGLRKGLFEQFSTIYVRDGSWSALPIDSTAPANAGNDFVDPETAYAATDIQTELKTQQPAYAYATD